MIAAPFATTPHTGPDPVLSQVTVTHRKPGLHSGSALAALPPTKTPRLKLPVLGRQRFSPTTTRHHNT